MDSADRRFAAEDLCCFRPTIVGCLQRVPHLRFAILYGSAAEGIPFRDLDIALVVDRGTVPVAADLDTEFGVVQALQSLLPCPVDVRVINEAPLAFRYNVSKGVPLLVNDQDAYFHFLERTWDEFLDFKPVAMRYLKELA